MITFFSNISPVCLRACVLFLNLVCMSCVLPMAAYGGMVSPAPATPCTPLLPDLDYYIDVTGTMDVEEIATPANTSAFHALNVKNLPDVVGVTWLRFTLAPLPEGGHPQAILLDLGQDVPADSVLYEPRINPITDGLEWREVPPGDRNLLLLPEAGPEPRTCYIRLDGLPGIWFSPMLRTPQNAATDWTRLSHKAALLALCVVMLLCLLRGFSEKGQWRIWTSLYVAMAIVHGFMGMPAYGSSGITSGQAAAVLSPGLALMLLPHVGRHLLCTKGRSRLLDVQFVLLTLPGAVLALLPLLPGFGWTIRYLSLWPACTLLFTFTALCGAVMGLGGARRYLLGCLIPPLCVAAGILGMDSGYAPALLASSPLWGTALSALLIAGTGHPRGTAQENQAQPAPQGAMSLDAVLTSHGMDDAPITLDEPLDDPNLRLLPPLSVSNADDARNSSAQDNHYPTEGASTYNTTRPDFHEWENLLRPPLDRLIREGAALGKCSLPPAVRQYAENMLCAAGEMAQLIDNPGKTPEQAQRNETPTAFNLQHLVREAHDSVAAAAESAGIGLAWYMPPLLGHMYEGLAQALRETLELLLESAVRATSHGAVHISVTRVPGSTEPGHLLFSVTDTGSGIPPQGRSSLALTRAWELAGANCGFLNVESGPQGASISFTMHLTPLESMETAPEPQTKRLPTIAVIADNAVDRQALAHMVTSLGCQSTEACTMHEALQRNREAPALMVVAQPAHDTPAEGDALGRFEAEAMQSGLPVFKALAITTDDRSWESLAERGYTHALLEPVDAKAFAATVDEVLHEAGFSASDQTDIPASPDDHTMNPSPLPDLFGTDSSSATSSAPDAILLPEPEDIAAGTAVIQNTEEQPLSLNTDEGIAQDIYAKPQSTPPLQEPTELPVLDLPQDGKASAEHNLTEVVTATDASLSAESPKPQQAPTSYTSSTQNAALAAPKETNSEAPTEEVAAMGNSTEEATLTPIPHNTSPENGTARTAGITASMNTWQDDFDEWVGEPMPLGTPLGTTVAHRDSSSQAQKPTAYTSAAKLASVSSAAHSSYVSPSLSAPGEWVGEPMPVTKPDLPAESHKDTPELPHTDAGRRILKLLGSSGDMPEQTSDSTIQNNIPEQQIQVPETDKDVAGSPSQTPDSFINFIAGASQEPPSAKPQKETIPEPNVQAQNSASDTVIQSTQANVPADIEEHEPAAQPETPIQTEPVGADQTIPQLIARLDAAIQDAQQGFKNRRCIVVGEAAERIASDSDAFGFRVLARMARCVERAAKAGDLQALQDLLPELAVAVERNRIALTPRH